MLFPFLAKLIYILISVIILKDKLDFFKVLTPFGKYFNKMLLKENDGEKTT